MGFRRWVQTFCLTIFLGLLFIASGDLILSPAADFFLRLDPSIALITTISSRHFLGGLIPAVVIILLTIFLGRFFCGHICPLGTTLDVADKVFAVPYKKRKNVGYLRSLKYLVLIALTGASLFGVSYIFLVSPLSLITRFYGLMILPAVNYLTGGAHQILFPLWEQLDINALLFFQIKSLRYQTQFFVLLFFTGLFSLSRITPRFWCRYLCPAGALFALFSRKPLVHRVVSDKCNECGKCVRACSMGAIDEADFLQTCFEDCVVCLTCEKICPESAITFSREPAPVQNGIISTLPTRRQFIVAGVAGTSTAMVSLTGLNSSVGKAGQGQVVPPMLIRPPATLPELDFLARCVRCGECMVACPTNTLQPIWFDAGLMGLFSPAITPRRGFCNPDCHRCAEVCPTESIRVISKEERVWAKTGTAMIHRQKCLAWEHDKKCMVCDEVCPFGAIEFTQESGLSVTVPKVKEEKCSGCGYCEYHCPVQNQSAIVVTPMNALRLTHGSFKVTAEQAGLKISRKEKSPPTYPGSEKSDSPAPGFDSNFAPGFDAGEDEKSSSAPGFSK
ncbi:MAG: 4Fe-4S binding protein [Deltaproteobacteria bacterium]|nr:4Fe-4S binding protein [Deltaproteobacteria bacterium]MBT4269470.1 4Fe-4S binding protein [Deltaproteobacteria bacterium]MBT4641692.1 4Fe-4S binding protein [Deltaproteobacteria bacterium]MBT7154015.1 4Fe-4S binding protein [Deltaproteobacteria bacterium]MBT7715298.1 4Fe-4S binding protein [Deltaproteobacteria bacterium]